MTRKDYIIIAAVFKRQIDNVREPAAHDGAVIKALYEAAVSMADALHMDNSRFDTSRFLTACGVTKELA